MFSTSTSAYGKTGDIIQGFDFAPVYNKSAVDSLRDMSPTQLAILGAVALVAVVAVVKVWRK